MFFKELSRFNKIFSAKKSKNEFLGLKMVKRFFRSKKILLGLKNQFLGLKSQKPGVRSKKPGVRCKKSKNHRYEKYFQI